jgi:nucleoid-associated protein YgaU
VVALQFRKPTEPATAQAGWAESPTPAQAPTAKHAPTDSTSATPTFTGRVEATNNDEPAPGMARALAELDRKVFPSQSTPPASNSQQNPANSQIPQPHGFVGSTKPLVPLESEEKIHRIADGDTLVKLAERYLGRADRSMELFAYNRDVLRTPDVLPIGADLRIPPMIPVQTADPTTRSQDDSDASLTRLVPVNPPSAAQSPNAPAAAVPTKGADAKSQKPRTYEVKTGDSLVDIARKLYGDGRKHEQLFEANRNVLKNPAALKPGMVLVVP